MTALDESGAAAGDMNDSRGGDGGTVVDGMQRLSLAARPPQRTPAQTARPLQPTARASPLYTTFATTAPALQSPYLPAAW